MVRVLGRISIFGTSAGLQPLIERHAIPNGVLSRSGQKRKIPDVDAYCYASAWYQFRCESLDDEVRHFLTAHLNLENVARSNEHRVDYALFSLCPVAHNEVFPCLLSLHNLKLLSRMGLSLEIAPAALMPEFDYWISI